MDAVPLLQHRHSEGQNKDGNIEFEELLHTIENNRKHSKHYIESAKKHQSTTSHVVKSKKQMQDEWRQARLEASNKTQSPEMAEKEIKEKDRERRRKITEDNDIDHRLITLHLQMIHLKVHVSMMLLWFVNLGM